jgi:peptidoglycan/xylan/chitin deacetylase (PgdA/CDA1 family)
VNRLRFVLQSRGLLNSAERIWQVGNRFGLSAARMQARLAAYAETVEKFGSRPSLPITARVLARNPQAASMLAARGVELCVHGLVHNDLSKLPADVQRDQISQACRIFRAHDIPFRGFRSPYLKYNRATLEAVEAEGFDYDSNLPFYWSPTESLARLSAGEREGLDRGLRFYGPAAYPGDRSLPRLLAKAVEIPVSLPDDEILLDRMGLSPERVAGVWLEMLATALARGELLTLQLHPERLSLLREPLRQLLDRAASGGFWLATLSEIATWWRERIGRQLQVQPAGAAEFRITADRPLGTELRLVDAAAGTASPVTLAGKVICRRKPVVGVSPDSPGDLRAKIREAGYFIDITTDSSLCGVYVRPEQTAAQALDEIASSHHPLLMETLWPKPACAALAITGDIDCLTLGDFLRRFREG